MVQRLCRILLVASICSASWQVGAGVAGAGLMDASVTVVPTRMCGNFFLVPLTFGDDAENTLVFVFDTGASYSLVDPEALERVSGKRLKTGRTARFSTPLKAGGISIKRLPATVRDLDHIARALGGEMDGILGFPTFEDVLLTLDYLNGEMRIAEGELGAPDGREIFELSRKEKRRPWVKAEIGGRTRSILIDSGSSGGISLENWSRLSFVSKPTNLDASMHIDRLSVYPIGRLDGDLVFAGARVVRPVLSLTGRTDLIGTKILHHFELTFDQKNRRMRLRRQDDAAIHLAGVRGTGAILGPTEHGLEVVQLLPGSPAEEAGLQEGDLVTGINGTPYDERECGRSFHRPGPGVESIVYTLVRDGASREMPVSVIDLVP